MSILGIDPGSEQSGYVLYRHSVPPIITGKGILPNEEMLCVINYRERDTFVIEMIASYGMPVGASIFETCIWIGRFIQAHGKPCHRIFRRDVKLHLCNSARAKDGNVRQALIDKFPATGGGKCPQIGTKEAPGPLHGMHGDEWAALGVAITFAEQKRG